MSAAEEALEEFRARNAIRIVMHTLFANFHGAALAYWNDCMRARR